MTTKINKQYSSPENHWNWPIKTNHKHGVRSGSKIWVGGQVDLNSDGKVQNYGDIEAQTSNVIASLYKVLEDLGSYCYDLVSLNCYYVRNDTIKDDREFLKLLTRFVYRGIHTTVNATPVPSLAYDGLMVQIEGIAMRQENGESINKNYLKSTGYSILPGSFVDMLHCENMLFISGQYPLDQYKQVVCKGDIVGQTKAVTHRIRELMHRFDGTLDDIVKLNRWYKGGSGIEDFEDSAMEMAWYFKEPGPVATGIPIPRHGDDDVLVKISAIAMLGPYRQRLPKQYSSPDSLWDWHVPLPYSHGLRCDGMIFVGGQASLDRQGCTVHPDDRSAQTHQAMEHIGTILKDLGAGYDDVCTMMTAYKGDCGTDGLHDNMSIRSSFFGSDGPVSGDVPFTDLAYDSMAVEIDACAMVAPDKQWS